jgi:uncharacterized protein (TIGR02246 family)
MPASTESPASPEDVLKRYLQLVRTRDLEGLVGLYDPAAIFVPKAGVKLIGHQAIRAGLAEMLKLEPQLELITTELHIADDTAFVANDYRFAGTAPDGSAIRDAGRSAVVMRRRRDDGGDDGWVIVIDRL